MSLSPGYARLVDAARQRVREITVSDALSRVPAGAALIDVREDREWAAGHARGATHLGRGVIEREIEAHAPEPDAEIILYCAGGFRSVLAAESLQRMGYTNVSSVIGGWRAWREANAPVELAEPESL